ncbi:MAG: tetratricopeptide repeat protein [Thermodesulfobacteriota bacterium]
MSHYFTDSLSTGLGDELFSNLKVMVVDDVPTIRRMLRQMLYQIGFRRNIYEASDGQEAWDILKDIPFDLVICDIAMPRITGLELLKMFRASPRYENTPFLMITGEVTDDIVAATAESEVSGYLLKPFKLHTLETRLYTIVSSRYLPGSGEQMFIQAKKLIADNQAHQALAILRKLLRPPFKKQAKVISLIGECHRILGETNQASNHFSMALNLNPRHLRSYTSMAGLLEDQGQYLEARYYLEKAQKLSPLNPERLFRLGQNCLQTGDQELAQQYLQEALQRGYGNNSSKRSRLETADVFLQAGLDQIAEEFLTQAIVEQPANVNLYNRLGIALRRQKKYDEALECYRKALDLAPQNEKVFYNLGILYFDMDDKEKSLQAFQTALKLKPDFPEAQEFMERSFPAPDAEREAV